MRPTRPVHLISWLAVALCLLLSNGPALAQQATPVPQTAFSVAVDAALLGVSGGTPQLGHSIDQPGWRLVQHFSYAALAVDSVVSGVLTVTSDGPLVVVAADGAGRAVPPGQATDIRSGETVLYRSDARTERRNDGTERVARNWLAIAAGPPDVREETGVSTTDGVWTLDAANWQPTTSGPVTITMRSGRGPAPGSGENFLGADTGETWLAVSYQPGVGPGAAAVDLSTGGATPVASPATAG